MPFHDALGGGSLLSGVYQDGGLCKRRFISSVEVWACTEIRAGAVVIKK